LILNREDELAREALLRIRAWLGKEVVSRQGEFYPRLAFKFCGGCNPAIERGEVAQKIRQELNPIVNWVSWEEGSDLVIIINGCSTACAEDGEIQKRASANLVVQLDRVSEVREKP
jgi:hypothetical protein